MKKNRSVLWFHGTKLSTKLKTHNKNKRKSSKNLEEERKQTKQIDLMSIEHIHAQIHPHIDSFSRLCFLVLVFGRMYGCALATNGSMHKTSE